MASTEWKESLVTRLLVAILIFMAGWVWWVDKEVAKQSEWKTNHKEHHVYSQKITKSIHENLAKDIGKIDTRCEQLSQETLLREFKHSRGERK